MSARAPRVRGLVAALVAGLAVMLLAGCGTTGTGDKGFVDGDGSVTEFPVGDRKPVGDIAGTTTSGRKITLSDLAEGRPTVINVWAEWCNPCRAEAAELGAAARQLGDKAAFLGISVRSTSKDNVRAFERTYDVGYPSIYDPDGRSLLQFPSGLAAQAMPSTLVLDSKGRVASVILGQVPSVRTVVELVRSADGTSS